MWDSALVHMFYREECFQAKAAQHKVAKRIGTHLISIGFQMVQVLCLLSLASFTCAPWFIPASMLQLVSRPWQRRFPFNQKNDFGLTALARPSLARPWQRRFAFNPKNDFGLTSRICIYARGHEWVGTSPWEIHCAVMKVDLIFRPPLPPRVLAILWAFPFVDRIRWLPVH